MGTTQGNSLCSYLYLKLAKCHNFIFTFLCFSSRKLENRRAEQVLPGGSAVGISERGEVVEKGVGG
jgi:hypothetical protein